MVDVSSLVVAIVSLVGTFLVAGITLAFQYFSDERKRLSETDKLVRKYRDPVFWAAFELQSRLYNICEQNLLAMYHLPSKHDLVVVYTAYLVGQYFSWTSIFRRQAQFLSIGIQEDHKRLNDLLTTISYTFATDGQPLGHSPLMLWRGQQSAIAEDMTVRDKSGELFCIGYATFFRKWNEEEEFRKWFASIEDGMRALTSTERGSERHAKLRMRYLHHLLFELLCLLDPKGLQWDKTTLNPCRLDAEEKNCCKCRPCKVGIGGRDKTGASEV